MTSVLECDFCAHRCRIPPGATGRCGVRRHVTVDAAGPGVETGRLETTVYGEVQAFATDPIEKKPLYHFLPGTGAFSLALGGCNFRCRFCQNESIAFAEHLRPVRQKWEPSDLVDAWRRSGVPTIAFTYTEPAVWQDFLIDCAELARREGARIVMITNGFFTPEAAERLVSVVDGFNIDLKGDDEFYRTLCRAAGDPVLDTIGRIAARCHVEVTTMLMERFHDEAVLADLQRHLADAGVKVWHLSRFHPAGEMRTEPATSERFLQAALAVVEQRDQRIPYLYAGNSRSNRYQQTSCPRCGRLVVHRGTSVRDDTDRGSCPACGCRIYGVFE